MRIKSTDFYFLEKKLSICSNLLLEEIKSFERAHKCQRQCVFVLTFLYSLLSGHSLETILNITAIHNKTEIWFENRDLFSNLSDHADGNATNCVDCESFRNSSIGKCGTRVHWEWLTIFKVKCCLVHSHFFISRLSEFSRRKSDTITV